MTEEITGLIFELKLIFALAIMFLVGIGCGIIIMAICNWEDKRDKVKKRIEIKEQLEKLLEKRNLVNFVTRNRNTPYRCKDEEQAKYVRAMLDGDMGEFVKPVKDMDHRPPELPSGTASPAMQNQIDGLRRRVDSLQTIVGRAKVERHNGSAKADKIELDQLTHRVDKLQSLSVSNFSIEKLRSWIDEIRADVEKKPTMDELEELWSVVKELKLAEYHRKNKRR